MAMKWITSEEARAAGSEEKQVLLEQTPDHYAEFGDYVRKELTRGGGALFFQGASGSVFRVGPVQAQGPGNPGGIEVCVRFSEGKEPPADETIDADLWHFMEWIVEGAGGEWTLGSLRKTGAIYRIPGAPTRA